MANDIFSELRNAALDLQAANHQSYERPLKTLGRLIRSPELAAPNAAVKALADFDAFVAGSDRDGGMVGSHKLNWPDDPVVCFDLTR